MSGHPVAQWVWPPKLSIVGGTWKEVQEVGSFLKEWKETWTTQGPCGPHKRFWFRCERYWKLCCGVVLHCSVTSDSVSPWTAACQDPLYMGFSRREHWSGLLFPTPGDLPDPRTEPASLASLHWQVNSLPPCHLGGLSKAGGAVTRSHSWQPYEVWVEGIVGIYDRWKD